MALSSLIVEVFIMMIENDRRTVYDLSVNPRLSMIIWKPGVTESFFVGDDVECPSMIKSSPWDSLVLRRSGWDVPLWKLRTVNSDHPRSRVESAALIRKVSGL